MGCTGGTHQRRSRRSGALPHHPGPQSRVLPDRPGRLNSLYDADVEGLTLVGRYGANAQHTLFYVVDADDVDAVQRFLRPGFTTCTATVTPVSEVPVPKD